jgi:2-keto-4-pentenoate hydratase/2-oxohepta-3-ene-1,7-dioic acid hydratase in catechol pathway
MFTLKKDGWYVYDQATDAWQPTGSKEFCIDLCNAGRSFNDVKDEQLKDSLPAFSGTKILCVGRNYRKHAAELGNEVPARPLWFSKPPSAIIGSNEKVIIPAGFGQIDYEGEVCLLINKRCRNIEPAQAADYIGGVTVGFDMTARELQKVDGQWTRAKGFDTFLPLARQVAPHTPDWKKALLMVKLNGLVVQESTLEAMVFNLEELVADISQCMTLEAGDLLMTGTPAGVGPVKKNDVLELTLNGPCLIDLCVTCI